MRTHRYVFLLASFQCYAGFNLKHFVKVELMSVGLVSPMTPIGSSGRFLLGASFDLNSFLVRNACFERLTGSYMRSYNLSLSTGRALREPFTADFATFVHLGPNIIYSDSLVSNQSQRWGVESTVRYRVFLFS